MPWFLAHAQRRLKNAPGALPCLRPSVACNSAKLVFMEFYTGGILLEFLSALQF
jgi:hypothetical protein